MLRGLYTAVSGMITNMKNQEIITNNIANVSTNGFKEDKLNVKSFDEVMLHNYDKKVSGINVKNQIGSISLGSQIDGVTTNFSQGQILSTENPLDFAINKEGFFKIQDNNGNEFYTRNGHFKLDSEGYLTDDNGNYVMGNDLLNNSESRIKLSSEDAVCDDNGVINDKGKTNYKLNTYILSENNLKKVGDNNYTGNSALNPNGSIKQNAIEGSNVNIIDSMVDMMRNMRSYEANQKVIAAIDETLGKSVNEVGSVK